ncbi:MAG: hypothetical protein GXP41_03195 [Chloroflexi bacterium]|nr:hypothetical protein [Chloroflexota bacterium]
MNASVQLRNIYLWAGTIAVHNWPVIVWLVLGGIAAVRAYRKPSRVALSFLYGFAGLVLLFEYRKHFMAYLAEPVDFLLLGGLRSFNPAGHFLVEEVIPGLLLVGSQILLMAGGLGWWYGVTEESANSVAVMPSVAQVPTLEEVEGVSARRWLFAGLAITALVAAIYRWKRMEVR